MIVRELLASAFRLLGLYGGGEVDTIADEDLADGLSALNELLNDWNVQHGTIYVIVNRLLPLTAATGVYTIGTGGTWDVPRPVKIESAGVTNNDGIRAELELIGSKQWNEIPEKNVQGRLPLRVYCDNDYPLATIRIWPIPSGPLQLDLNAWDELEDNYTLDAPFDLPPSYLRAIRFNLAVTLSSEYGKGSQLDGTVAAIAQQSKAELFALNASTFAGTQDPPAEAA